MKGSLHSGTVSQIYIILGDPGADSGGEGKSKRAGKYGTKKSKERREGLSRRSLLFFEPYFSARLDFEDENHFLLDCKAYSQIRDIFFSKLETKYLTSNHFHTIL